MRGVLLEIKVLMVNLIHENKFFFKGSFSWNNLLRPKKKKKITKIMEALTVRGTQIKRIGIKNPPNKTHKHKFQFIL